MQPQNKHQYMAKVKAIERENRKRILKVNPDIDDKPGIYFLTRQDPETSINYFYIGLAHKSLLTRMSQHLTGYQHIDLSIRKRKFYSKDNPGGWKLNFIHYPADEVEKWEQYWILQYTKKGYQCRYNKTSGGSEGTEKINEFKPSKGYRDGLFQGRKNASREIAHLFEKHLDFKPKSDKPNKNQEKAVIKFKEFLEYYKNN